MVTYWSDKSADNTGWTVPGSATVRGTSVGTGSGHITAAVADRGVTAGNGARARCQRLHRRQQGRGVERGDRTVLDG